MTASTLPKAGALETAAFLSEVAIPTIAKGVIIRRRSVVSLVERLDLDRRAVRRVQGLRDRYGEGPLLLQNPVRPQALILAQSDVRRVLEETPNPFSPASSEKRAALSHFEPHVSLVSRGEARCRRQAFNRAVLESACPVHSMAGAFLAVIEAEIERALPSLELAGGLDWTRFFALWMRIVRRIVFGQGAADDRELTALSERLRGRANWAFALPVDRRVRARYHERLRHHLDRAEAHSLAALAARHETGPDDRATDQIAQWLFAFDPAGMTIVRAMALLLAHPEHVRALRDEASDAPAGAPETARAAFLETLRLYPTTPLILRQTVRRSEWSTGALPAGAGVMIYAPFFHRDESRVETAHGFSPDRFRGVGPADALPFVPFSAGNGACPARRLVPLLGAMMLAGLLRRGLEWPDRQRRLPPGRDLPCEFDPYTLWFPLDGLSA